MSTLDGVVGKCLSGEFAEPSLHFKRRVSGPPTRVCFVMNGIDDFSPRLEGDKYYAEEV
jgi:hypothetical protein